MSSNHREKRRTFWLSVFFLLWFFFIVFSLVRIQVFEYGRHSAKIRSQTLRILDLHPKRGTIYDRNGDILAISIKTKSAFLSNKYTPSSLNVFSRVSRSIALSDHQKINVRKRIRRGEKFVWIKRKLTDGEYGALSGLNLFES
jgi:cell division protein FtsI/penicillin-binding protein 2